VGFPLLGKFFKGRSLEHEARRFLALTRYGQSRAVSEGVPMFLWIDPQTASYGLEAQFGYVQEDEKAVEFTIDDELELEVEPAVVSLLLSTTTPPPALPGLPNASIIRFTPDGFIAETSPEGIWFRRNEETGIWVNLSPNRLNYEIQSQPPTIVRR
jgi:hypothetical protein